LYKVLLYNHGRRERPELKEKRRTNTMMNSTIEKAMSFRDYIEETTENLRNYIRWNYGERPGADEVNDSAWIADDVTGNGSGSFTFNAWQAAANVAQLIWDDEFIDELSGSFGENIGELIKRGPEAVDVTARCLALGYIDIEALLDEIFPEEEEEEND